MTGALLGVNVLKNVLFWQVTVNGRVVKAVQGQRLRDAVGASGAKIEYGCEKVRVRVRVLAHTHTILRQRLELRPVQSRQ